MQPAVPATGPVPADYPQPAPYADFKGVRAKALWYPTEELARRQFEICRDEPRKKVEIFTVLDPKGQPLSLAHGHMATMTDCTDLLTGEGEITLTTYHYTKPPDICTVKDKNHPKDASIPCQLSNVGFPGQDTLPVSGLPLHFDMNSSPFELISTEPFTDERGVSATRLKLRIRYNRLVGEQIYTVNRIYEDGNAEFAPSGRSVLITWWLGGLKDFGGKPLEGQKITFDPIADVPASTSSVPLKATNSSGLDVNYFVVYGPGVIRDGAFVPTEVPAGFTKPIPVQIGAYHPGRYSGDKLYRCASTVYQTFHLTP